MVRDGMMSQSSYMLSWLVVVFFLGMAWYVFDRSVGYKLYKLWYNWTNKEKLPDNAEMGFVYKRKAKVRVAWATAISAFQSALAIYGSDVNPFFELICFFFEIPVILAGFYAGPGLYYIWSRKDKALDKLDRIESGEVNLGEEIQKVSSQAGAAIRHVLDSDDDKEQQPEAVAVTAEAAVSTKPQAGEPDPFEMVRKFTRGPGYGLAASEADEDEGKADGGS